VPRHHGDRSRAAHVLPRRSDSAEADDLALRPTPLSTGTGPLLDALEAALRDRGVALRPGLEPAEVERRLVSAGLPARPELVEWWAWHDGADEEIVESWRALALDEALERRDELGRNYADAGAPERWPASWQPLLAFAGAPVLCVDASTGAVHVEDDGFPEPSPPQFASLEDLVRTLQRAASPGVTALGSASDPELRRLWWW
jgi:hypothetical protein